MTPRTIAARFGVTPRRVRRIPRGFVNRVWLVDADEGRFVLKRVSEYRRPEDLRHEHELLDWLGDAGWSVPVPIAVGGSTIMTDAEGVRWWLAPWVRGRAPNKRADGYAAWAGQLLAELHATTMRFEPSVADDNSRLRNIADWQFIGGTDVTLRTGIEDFANREPELASAVGVALDEVHGALAALPPGPETTVHFDFHAGNVRVWRGGVGVLDFDFSHQDERAADIAAALHFVSSDNAKRFVDGYCRHTAMADAELARVPVLWRARWLMHAAWLLSGPAGVDVPTEVAGVLSNLGTEQSLGAGLL